MKTLDPVLVDDAADAVAVVDVVGNVTVEVRDAATGDLIHTECVHNKVVASGRDVLRDLILRGTPAPGWIAVGKADTAAVMVVADTDVALVAEYYRAAVTKRNSNTGRATFQLHLTTADANLSPAEIDDDVALREVGLFANTKYAADGSPLNGGRLFARALVTPIVKTALITVTFTWEFPISST